MPKLAACITPRFLLAAWPPGGTPERRPASPEPLQCTNYAGTQVAPPKLGIFAFQNTGLNSNSHMLQSASSRQKARRKPAAAQGELCKTFFSRTAGQRPSQSTKQHFPQPITTSIWLQTPQYSGELQWNRVYSTSTCIFSPGGRKHRPCTSSAPTKKQYIWKTVDQSRYTRLTVHCKERQNGCTASSGLD
jgi:hypothetical protein